MQDVPDYIEKWAQWRIKRSGYGMGWPSADSVGRAMAGVPGTGCPTCSGKGKVDGKSIGVNMPYVICPTCGGEGKVTMEDKPARQVTKKCLVCDGRGEIGDDVKRTCFKCRGIGEIVQVTHKANPAGIRGTAHMANDDDPISQRIDFIVGTELTEGQRSVLLMEYTRGGTQEVKALRKGISQGYYSKLLAGAIEKIEECLQLDVQE